MRDEQRRRKAEQKDNLNQEKEYINRLKLEMEQERQMQAEKRKQEREYHQRMMIENEKNKLLDEDELNHYAFRKDRLANMLEDDDSVALADRSRGRRGV